MRTIIKISKVIPSAVKINFLFIIEEFSPFDKYFFVSLLLFSILHSCA